MKDASFVFDANRCTGCGACRVACTIENALAPEVSWRRIETFNPRHHPIAPVFHLSLACNHCADAACMRACPALAYGRDEASGAVLLDADRCIGCRYCSWACPYDAPVFDEAMGVMTKCTWCVDRLRAGLEPACATHCPTGALGYAEVPAGERVQAMEGLPEATLEPNLHVIPLKPGRLQPEMQLPASSFELPADRPPIPRLDRDGLSLSQASAAISLRHEWPLAAFTLFAATLVAIVTAAAEGAFRIGPWSLAVAAAITMAVGGGHLGRKARAWRAILNLRHSWLSREVTLLSLFFAVATWWLLRAPESRALGLTTAAVGMLALFAADRVYGVLPAGPGYRHSASVLWTGVLLATILMGEPQLAALVAFAKLTTYVRRRREFASAHGTARAALSAIRSLPTIAAPLVLWVAVPQDARLVAFALALAGEAIGRCEYYMELVRETPRRRMDLALARRVGERPAGGTVALPAPAEI